MNFRGSSGRKNEKIQSLKCAVFLIKSIDIPWKRHHNGEVGSNSKYVQIRRFFHEERTAYRTEAYAALS